MEVTALLTLLATLLVSGGLWWLAAGGRAAVAAWIRENLVYEPDFDPDQVGDPSAEDSELDPPRHHHALIQCPATTKSGTQCRRMGLPSWGGCCLQHARMQLKSYLEDPRGPRNEALERLREYLDND